MSPFCVYFDNASRYNSRTALWCRLGSNAHGEHSQRCSTYCWCLNLWRRALLSDQNNQTSFTDAEIKDYLQRALDWGDVIQAGLAAKALGLDTATLPLLERERAVLADYSEASARAEIEHNLGEIAAGRMAPPHR